MKFAAYSLVTQLGQSPLSNTYLASPSGQPEREVVIKIFHPSCLGPGYEARDFLRDAARLQQLAHPHLLPVFDVDIEQQQPFVVSPYLSRGSLRNHLRTLSPSRFSVACTLRLGIQIGQALSYCHTNDLLHGHLTPDNVLFVDDETVQLADFGLAFLIDESASDASTQPQTIAYRAPEQFMSLVSRKSDQFSLGCLLYELLTGTLPATSSNSPLAPSRLAPHISEALDAVLLKALAHEPTARYASVAQLVEALQAISASDEDISATRSYPQPRSGSSAASLHASTPLSNPSREDNLAFPFMPEASVSYRHILSPLELEDMDGPGEPKAKQPFQEEPAAKEQTLPDMSRKRIQEAETLVPVRAVAMPPKPLVPPPASNNRGSSRVAATTPKLPFRYRWLIPVLLVQLLLSGVLGVLAHYSLMSGNYLAWWASPTVSAPTLTATAQQQIYTQAISGVPVLDDPLTGESENQWQTWFIDNQNSKDGCNFTGRVYQASLSKAPYFGRCMALATNFSNLAYQVEMSVIAGDGGGLIFRSNANTEYRFRVDASGYYDLADVPPENVHYNRLTKPVHTGLNQWNLLTAVAKDSDLYLYINKQLVMYCHDSSSSSGNIGLFAIDAEHPTTVQFRNAKVWAL
jgi:serine/threonine protein kinase